MNKRNTGLIFLLFLMAMPCIFFIYSFTEKKVIEYRMTERLMVENLQVITIDADSVIWLRENEELLINGQPFDVENLNINGDKIVVSGLFDADEKELNQQIVNFGKASDRSSQANHSLILLIFSPYFQEKETISLPAPVLVQNKQAWQYYDESTCIFYYDILTPPPQFI